jgi:hypothetical protein
VSIVEKTILGMLPFIDLANHGFGVVNTNAMRKEMPSEFLSYVVNSPGDVASGQEFLQTLVSIVFLRFLSLIRGGGVRVTILHLLLLSYFGILAFSRALGFWQPFIFG